MTKYITEKEIPGAQVAVGKNGKILFSKGFGFGDRDKQIAVSPKSLFRIASISKPVTAAAVLSYVEQGNLTLETKMLEAVKIEPFLGGGKMLDERVKQITIRHLLNHTSGWDRDAKGVGDQMFMNREAAKELELPAPLGPRDIIRWALGRELQFDPGARYAYSNLGYCILGRILENLSGQSYEKVIRERVFKPVGITAPLLGASLTTADGEVRYYMAKSDREQMGESIFPQTPKKVPIPYGVWSQESLDSHGGWISSAEDIVRFGMSLPDIGGTSPFKKKETWDLVTEVPPGAPGHKEDGTVKDSYYAAGFQVRKAREGSRITHSGELPGTTTYLFRRADGYAYAVFFNQRIREGKVDAKDRLENQIHALLDEAPEWA